MPNLNFKDLLGSLHNAIVEAQKLTETQHMRQFRRYFKEHPDLGILTPDMITISIPEHERISGTVSEAGADPGRDHRA